jgi:beta-lactamase class A
LPAAAVAALLGLLILLLAPAPAAAGATASAGAATTAGVTCMSKAHPAMAAALARDIAAARRGRSSTVAVWVDAPTTGVSCSLNASAHFDSASVVKVTILEALLHKALDQHRYLTDREADLARAMITRSDNNAASALWASVGRTAIQHLLNVAGMRQTILGPDGYWGLTQLTAHDEVLALRLLFNPNSVLTYNSRAYGLGLMAQVISAQRWGVPAGAPRSVVVHVKNGWLPRATHGWRINSIGGFSWRGGWYSIVVLSQDNPTMSYGITTVEAIARVIHRDLNPTVTAVVPPSKPSATWETPDERLPALPATP